MGPIRGTLVLWAERFVRTLERQRVSPDDLRNKVEEIPDPYETSWSFSRLPILLRGVYSSNHETLHRVGTQLPKTLLMVLNTETEKWYSPTPISTRYHILIRPARVTECGH